MSTHIAAIVTALHGKPVQIVERPDNWQLRTRIENALQALRWPEQDEDVSWAHQDAVSALAALYNRLTVAEANAALYKMQKQRAIDAFDDQSEECEQMKRELGR